MPRTSRLDVLDVVQHVMARGIEGTAVFRGDRDREEFLRRLSLVVDRGNAQLLGWALMTNHFHLVLRPKDWYLKDLMRRLMTGYAVWFNLRYRRKGHLFQNRYRSIVVEEEPYLLALVRYVHLNPVRVGTVTTIDSLDRYPYTGHSVLLGHRSYPVQDDTEILGRFGESWEVARRRYRSFVAAGFSKGVQPEFRGGGLVRSAGGWDELKRRSKNERELGDERILGSGAFVEQLVGHEREDVEPRRDVADVLAEVAAQWGVEVDDILGPARLRWICRCRTEFYERARREAGQSYADLGRITGRTESAVWQAVQHRQRGAQKRHRSETP